MKLFALDPHAIYRQGLVGCLAALPDVTEISSAGTVDEAWADEALGSADVVVVDAAFEGGLAFVRDVCEHTDARVVVCSSRSDETDLLAAVDAGAVGYLSKDALTPETLVAGVRVAATGAGVMAPELLGALLRGITRVSREVLEPRGLSLSRLTAREQDVLRLLAQGHPTREVADRLCYSERTIKNVIHDAVTKLNARTRSQAVALAVRDGLI
jgi:DNA-binding NarL/FixJ family response regulator